MKKVFNWDDLKNQWLIEERGISFEDVIFYIQQGKLLDDLVHPNLKKYSSQRVFIIEIEKYVYLVPYVENDEEIFLKTIIQQKGH